MIVYNVSIDFKRVKGVSAFSGIHHSYVNIEELQASVSQTQTKYLQLFTLPMTGKLTAV